MPPATGGSEVGPEDSLDITIVLDHFVIGTLEVLPSGVRDNQGIVRELVRIDDVVTGA